MNKYEAYHLLGLEEGATEEEIKIAFKELAQILHPDKFPNNSKLQDRASEQFKLVSQAKDVLLSQTHRASRQSHRSTESHNQKTDEEIRWSSLESTRLFLIAQKNIELDWRRNGLLMLLGAMVVSLVLRRYPPFMAILTAVGIYGLSMAIGHHLQVKSINEHIEKIEAEQRSLGSKGK